MSNKCNHTLGYYEIYEYDNNETIIVNTNEIYGLSTVDILKKDGTLFNYCPDCGESLSGLLNTIEESLKQKLQEEKKNKEQEQAKKKEDFDKLVIEVSSRTKLCNLSDEGNFIVIVKALKEHGSNYILGGDKDYLKKAATGIVKTNPNKELEILKIYKMPTLSELKTLMESHGYEVKNTEMAGYPELSCKKLFLNKKLHVMINSSCTMIYVNTTIFDADGESYTSYDNFGTHKLGEFLKTEFVLEEINL